MYTIQGHSDTVREVVFSPDGHFLLSCARGEIILWNSSLEKKLKTFTGHTASINSAMFSPDGRFILSGSSDNTIRLWEIENCKCIRVFKGHTNAVNSVTFSPDMRFILSGSKDKTIRLWELVWDYEFPEISDWDEGARPYLEIFLTLHTPYAKKLSKKDKPSEQEIQFAISRCSRNWLGFYIKPKWGKEDFRKLIRELQYRGYGWLRPEGVRKKLEEMTAKWKGPPPLPGQ
jgi:WD40 repeat protein